MKGKNEALIKKTSQQHIHNKAGVGGDKTSIKQNNISYPNTKHIHIGGDETYINAE